MLFAHSSLQPPNLAVQLRSQRAIEGLSLPIVPLDLLLEIGFFLLAGDFGLFALRVLDIASSVAGPGSRVQRPCLGESRANSALRPAEAAGPDGTRQGSRVNSRDVAS